MRLRLLATLCLSISACSLILDPDELSNGRTDAGALQDGGRDASADDGGRDSSVPVADSGLRADGGLPTDSGTEVDAGGPTRTNLRFMQSVMPPELPGGDRDDFRSGVVVHPRSRTAFLPSRARLYAMPIMDDGSLGAMSAVIPQNIDDNWDFRHARIHEDRLYLPRTTTSTFETRNIDGTGSLSETSFSPYGGAGGASVQGIVDIVFPTGGIHPVQGFGNNAGILSDANGAGAPLDIAILSDRRPSTPGAVAVGSRIYFSFADSARAGSNDPLTHPAPLEIGFRDDGTGALQKVLLDPRILSNTQAPLAHCEGSFATIGTTAPTGSDTRYRGTLVFFDTALEEQARIPVDELRALDIIFSPDCRSVAVAGQFQSGPVTAGHIRIFDIRNVEDINEIGRFTSDVSEISGFRPGPFVDHLTNHEWTMFSTSNETYEGPPINRFEWFLQEAP